MDPINQLFNFVERCEHALVNFHPYLALMFIEMRIMPTFVHTVYCGNDLYAQVLLLYIQINSTVGVRSARSVSWQPRLVALRQLVISTSSAPGASARKSPSAATGFLRTRLVNLERTTFDI